jgi:hypothetical protein
VQALLGQVRDAALVVLAVKNVDLVAMEDFLEFLLHWLAPRRVVLWRG